MSTFGPLQQLHRLETSSSQFPAQITSILDGTEYNVWIQNLQEGDLSRIVEYFDNVLGTSDSTSPVFRICLRELRRICGIYHTLPPSYTIPDSPLDISCGPTVRGSYGNTHEGSLNNSTVRVKRLLTPSEGAGQDCTKNFYEEAVAWKNLEHPNIVSLLGVTITAPPFQLISDWISGEDLTKYVGNNPGADKLRLLSGTTNGLEYLHSHNVVHGNLKGSNILVDDSGRVRITDFGLATIPRGSVPMWGLHDDQNLRWTAPEILHEFGTYSKEADIFAFAMVMIEVFTGAVPFDNSPLLTAMMAIMKGDRPQRPTNTACSDELWAIMQRCWDQEPRRRPEVLEVSQVLHGGTLDRLRRLHTHGMASHEFQCALTQFYCSTGYKDHMDGLKDTDGRNFVDFLYEVLWTKGLNQSLLQQTLHSIRSICSHQAIIPDSCVVSDALYQADQSSGVWTWKLKHLQGGDNQNDVRVSVTKVEKTRKELYGEVATWAWLDHPNILPCFGITLDPFQVVTEWVPHRNVIEYVRIHSNVDRVCLLIDVVQGLHYLHSYEVIHRSLKPQNILVNAAGRACLSDIGFTTSTHDEVLDEDDAESSDYRWRAPEVLKDGRFSKQSDIFSFGFVAAEILIGETSWRGVSTTDVKSKIIYGERPRMPKGKAELGVTAEMWGMLTKCWEAEAQDRITISGVLSFLQYTPQPISGSSQKFGEATARSRRPPDQDFIDKLDEILERDEISDQERTGFLNILCKMCSRQKSVPKSMRIDCLGSEQTHEVYRGGQASVFKGEYHGRLVAIKVVQLYINNLERGLSRFYREAIVWKHLQHPNILPLLGVDMNLGNQKYAMVSDWMDNGNINEFIQKHKEVNRAQLLVDAAFGLEYMHGLQFVHGDLKGANILVTKAGRACLGDFGLTTITSGASAASTSTTSLMSFTEGGTTRWMSPELLHPERFGAKGFRPTAQSDCYALGMVVYEVLFGKPPYFEIPDRYVVMDAIMRGVRPRKPHGADSFGFTDGLWRIVERSWMADIDARPDVKTMLYHFNHAASVWNKKRNI